MKLSYIVHRGMAITGQNMEEIYNEFKARFRSGSLDKNSQRWVENKEAIEIVEDRLGRLDALGSSDHIP